MLRNGFLRLVNFKINNIGIVTQVIQIMTWYNPERENSHNESTTREVNYFCVHHFFLLFLLRKGLSEGMQESVPEVEIKGKFNTFQD